MDIASDQALRRRALVVFSDGEDTSSVVTFDQMLELAKRSGAAIYTVGLRSMNPAVKSREAEWVLRTLAYETGGRAFFPEKIDELTSVYSMIADEIANQYVLGYTSSNATRNGAWRRVQVRLSRPNTTARTKSGYFAPNERR